MDSIGHRLGILGAIMFSYLALWSMEIAQWLLVHDWRTQESKGLTEKPLDGYAICDIQNVFVRFISLRFVRLAVWFYQFAHREEHVSDSIHNALEQHKKERKANEKD